MRQIIFRGKSIKAGRWLFGDLLRTPGNTGDGVAIQYYDKTDGWMFEDVREDTVGQFTGLYDKNGKEIYEGDIVDLRPRYIRPHRIEYSYGQWICVDADAGWIPLIEDWQLGDEMNDVEVIGNIFDNPEMMEKDKED